MQNILSELKNLDENQLISLNRQVIAQLKFLRAAQTRAMKESLSEGDSVTWHGRKGHQRGTVTSIKRKFAHVTTIKGGTWRVPMNMLKKV